MGNENDRLSSENENDLSSLNTSGDIQSNQLKVSHSGNSDVDVHVDVHVDVSPIAFAMLYSLVANKQLSMVEFEEALEKLEQYKIKKNNNTSQKN